MKRYNPKELEPKWQKTWVASEIYKAAEDSTKPKRYVLEYFPYPSGAAMHVGHVRNYTIGDVVARFNRMKGYDVLHPMGWDAFGLPAENYAIRNKISPRKAIDENTKRFKQQLMQMGFSYDWSREIDSTDPNYYKWTQFFFLLLYKRELAYRKESLQWWCPVDKTVLANEQVEDGKCWRCGNQVEKKSLPQWFFKITEYADRLLEDLDDLNWSEAIKSMQRNWIGKSKGAEIDFAIEKTNIKRFVLLHGKGGSSKGNFLPWLKEQLENRGFEVEVPDMPNAKEPNDDEQTAYVLKHCKLDQQTAVVGHSFGGIVALRLLESGVKLAQVTLVGTPFSDQFIDGKARPTVSDAVSKGFKFDVIKNNCKNIVALYDTKDHVVSVADGQAFASHLSCKLVQSVGQETHFCGQEEPEVLRQTLPIIRVFTTAHDTIYGVTFMVLAPEHELVSQITTAEHKANVNSYIKMAQAKTEIERQEEDKEKTGVFTGAYAINPINNKKIPIWIADYVLSGYGTGAVMAVPGEDYRDHVFAKKYNLPIIYTTDRQKFVNYQTELKQNPKKYKLANSEEFDGLDFFQGRQKILDKLIQSGAGEEKINYKIRDWLISRQRYWGAPIPIIHCPVDGIVPVPESDLPVKLPEIKSYEPSGDGRSPLANVPEFVNTKCPKCGGEAQRETDTMDGFACSSWYFLRFADPHNTKEAFDAKKAEFWLPVDDYIGGAEHAVMHLLYARFWTKVMYDEGLIKFKEPFASLRNQGMILAPDGQKMSKSKGNTIEPDELIGQGYGADSIRLMELFIGPWNQAASWSVEGIGGTFRFLQRVWTLTQEFIDSKDKDSSQTNEELLKISHQAIQKVSRDLQEMSFNTAIAALMEATNQLYKIKARSGFADKASWEFALKTITQLLAPFAPHIAEELWQDLGQKESVHISEWPVHEEKYLVSDNLTIVVQVNGKLRANIVVAADSSEEEVVKLAQADPKVVEHLNKKEVRRTIYVPAKLVNFVI